MLDVLNRLQQPDCRTLLVAAAGNDGSDVALFYPAAFAPVDPFVAGHPIVSVGALRQNRAGRACFSNSRRVTLFEDGERLVNAFPTGRFVYREPLSQSAPPQCVYHRTPLYDGCTCVTAPAKGATAHFRGMASWSGTSFSAPIVVGRVAAHMTERPKFANRPRAAMKDLLKQLVVIEDASDSRNLRIFPNPVG
jgi:subtilisin family serine protease